MFARIALVTYAVVFMSVRSLIGKLRGVFANLDFDRMDFWTVALIIEAIVLWIVLRMFV
jgi:hypothetical protein